MLSNSLSFLRIKNFVTRHLYFPRTRKKKVSSWSGKRLSAARGTFLQHASVRRFGNSSLMLWENHILNVFALKTCVLIVKISNFNLLKARFYTALVSFSSSFQLCGHTHAQCLVWGVIFSPPLPPSLIQTFRYVGRTLVKLNLMHTSITEQKYVLLAFILGYMLVLHYPSWVLNWVTELAVCWGKPDVYSKKTIVLGPELSLKSASNSHSIFLSLSSPTKKKKINWELFKNAF